MSHEVVEALKRLDVAGDPAFHRALIECGQAARFMEAEEATK
jgi:hypothetical protein